MYPGLRFTPVEFSREADHSHIPFEDGLPVVITEYSGMYQQWAPVLED